MWGWATWRRAWNGYDVSMSDWPTNKLALLAWLGHRHDAIWHWVDKFDATYLGKIDTWDYQWIWRVMKERGLVVTPAYNMITNLGFNPDATHTTNSEWHLARRPIETFPLARLHPQHPVKRDRTAERYIELCRLEIRPRGIKSSFVANLRRAYSMTTTYTRNPKPIE
jgi:hypothetical protein